MKRSLITLVLAAAAITGPAAFADTLTYRSTMSGPSEVPPNPSPGAGIATVVIDDVANTMLMTIPFFDLVGATTVAHIHCCTSTALDGTAIPATMTPTLTDFPVNVRAGNYNMMFDLTNPLTYNSAFLTAHGGTAASAEAALLGGLAANQAYLNVHTDVYPAGEIRGFLVLAPTQPVPEPSQWMMLLGGLGATAFTLRRRRT